MPVSNALGKHGRPDRNTSLEWGGVKFQMCGTRVLKAKTKTVMLKASIFKYNYLYILKAILSGLDENRKRGTNHVQSLPKLRFGQICANSNGQNAHLWVTHDGKTKLMRLACISGKVDNIYIYHDIRIKKCIINT